MECEARPLGAEFTGSATHTWGSSQLSVPGDDKYMVPHSLIYGMPYHWRVRWRYDPVTTLFMPASRWLSVPRNGWNETDLCTSGSRLMLPSVLRSH